MLEVNRGDNFETKAGANALANSTAEVWQYHDSHECAFSCFRRIDRRRRKINRRIVEQQSGTKNDRCRRGKIEGEKARAEGQSPWDGFVLSRAMLVRV
jgi:hypothetical protein